MKHVVIELNGPNEPVMFTNSILGNYSFNVCATETCFGEFHVETVEETLTNTQLEALPHNPTDELSCIIVDDRTNFVDNSSIDVTLESIFCLILSSPIVLGWDASCKGFVGRP